MKVKSDGPTRERYSEVRIAEEITSVTHDMNRLPQFAIMRIDLLKRQPRQLQECGVEVELSALDRGELPGSRHFG